MRFEEQFGKWIGWDLVDTACFQFYEFTFSKDFGPWKVGYIAKSLVFSLDKSTIEEYDDKGSVIASQQRAR
jgi:hypothetical protein